MEKQKKKKKNILMFRQHTCGAPEIHFSLWTQLL